jgi:nucleoside-diphosphate-sugar epimerase
MENLLGMRQGVEGGTLNFPLDPATRLQMIAVDDIGGIVAAAFERPGKWHGRTVELAGDEMSMTELAQALSVAMGREVRYVQTPWDEFEKQAGKEMTLMYRWFQETGYHVEIGAVRQEYPGLTTFAKWLNSHWHTAVQRAG